MNDPTLWEALRTAALAISLAACAGLRAWLPLLLAGVLARTGMLTLGSAFGFLGSTQALLVFGAATVVELAGDKVPALDHALDALGTVLRPAAGALLAASVIGRFEDPLIAVALGIVLGAPTALVPHAAKATLRGASSAITAGFANPVLSVIEDAFTFVLFVLSVVLPILVAVVSITTTVVVVRRLLRRPRAAEPKP